MLTPSDVTCDGCDAFVRLTATGVRTPPEEKPRTAADSPPSTRVE
jgi:hypothetical protein